jgi:uncharacterized membrane protein
MRNWLMANGHGETIGMIFQRGLTMGNYDTYLHIIVVEMIVILAIVRPYMENKAPKQIVTKMLLLCVGFMFIHIATHFLPNKIASFIYSSHDELYAKTSTRG